MKMSGKKINRVVLLLVIFEQKMWRSEKEAYLRVRFSWKATHYEKKSCTINQITERQTQVKAKA